MTSDTGLSDPIMDQLKEIQPFPQTASQVILACENANVNPSELCEIIQCDPAISMKIMRVANSSAYGLSGEVRTLQQAVVVLGLRALRNLAISVAAQGVITGGKQAKAARDQLWQHSIGCAAVSVLLAKRVPAVAAEEAFLAAIVHDVGKLLFLDSVPEQYCQAIDHGAGQCVIEVEQQTFGSDHQQLGLLCADEWGLPLDIADAIGAHHDIHQDQENDNPELVNLVGLADSLSRQWGIGGSGHDVDLEALLQRANLGLAIDEVRELEEQANQQYEELCSAFA